MQIQAQVEPFWTALTVWGIVNCVNILQGIGFLSRLRTGSLAVNHILGYVMIALAIPAGVAVIVFWQAGTSWLHRIGPLVYVIFILLLIAVEYIWPVEFRSPARPLILVPYLLLFFGSILLMGLPMFRINRSLWLVTAFTTVFLLGSMGAAMIKGVG